MPQFDPAQRELQLKLVYYGPPLSGKTTNLQILSRVVRAQARGRLMTLDAADERTLFCDVLPIFWTTANGVRIKLGVYSVPGQIMHRAARRLLLAATDGVIFVADSQREESIANQDAWRSMNRNLLAHELSPGRLPVILQFNKQDLPSARPAEALRQLRARTSIPIFAASAIRAEGVLEPFFACLRGMFLDALADPPIAAGLAASPDELLREVAMLVDWDQVSAPEGAPEGEWWTEFGSARVAPPAAVAGPTGHGPAQGAADTAESLFSPSPNPTR